LLSEYSTYLLVKFKDLNKNNAQVIIKVFHKNQTDSGKAELNILQNLNEADEFDNAHIIRYTESFEDNGHFCIVLSGIFYSLTEGIHSLGSQSLVLSDIRLIALQLLSSLALLEQRNIIHGNLLLENIFIVESDHKKSLHIDEGKTYIRLANFEKSIHLNNISDVKDIDKYQPISIRAPETIFNQYIGIQMDMWSFGCILVELFLGYPLFSLGTNSNFNLLSKMVQFFGVPKLFENEASYKTYFSEDHKLLSHESISTSNSLHSSSPAISMPFQSSSTSGENTFSKFFENVDPDFFDFLKRLLCYNPKERLTPASALVHPFLFPVSYDLFFSFGEDRVELEEEKESLRKSFELNTRKLRDQFQLDISKIQEEFENQRKLTKKRHKSEIDNLVQSFEKEKIKMLHEFDKEKANLLGTFKEQLSQAKSSFYDRELDLRATFEQEKKALAKKYAEEILEKERALRQAEKHIDELYASIRQIRQSIANPEVPKEKKQTKKRTRDNTHFEDFLNERRLKKPHYESQKDSEEDEEDQDKNLSNVLEEKVKQRKRILEKEKGFEKEKQKEERRKREEEKEKSRKLQKGNTKETYVSSSGEEYEINVSPVPFEKEKIHPSSSSPPVSSNVNTVNNNNNSTNLQGEQRNLLRGSYQNARRLLRSLSKSSFE